MTDGELTGDAIDPATVTATDVSGALTVSSIGPGTFNFANDSIVPAFTRDVIYPADFVVALPHAIAFVDAGTLVAPFDGEVPAGTCDLDEALVSETNTVVLRFNADVLNPLPPASAFRLRILGVETIPDSVTRDDTNAILLAFHTDPVNPTHVTILVPTAINFAGGSLLEAPFDVDLPYP